MTPSQLNRIDVLIAESRGWRLIEPCGLGVAPGDRDGVFSEVPTPSQGLSAAVDLLGDDGFAGWDVMKSFGRKLRYICDIYGQNDETWSADANTPQLAISLAYCKARGIELPKE